MKEKSKNKNKKNGTLYNLYNSYKLNKKGGVVPLKKMTQEEMNYYQDFMAIKADATQLLHEIDYVETISLQMCQELTSKIHRIKNPIINYIHSVLVPDMFDIIYNEDRVVIEGPNMDKVSEFIKNNVFSEAEYEEHLAIFLKIMNQYNDATPDELEKYSLLFYKFYLKGGSAMKLIYNSYKEQILHHFAKDFDTFLSPDEKNAFLGKNSDYDFDFLINENVKEKHYNELVVIACKLISNFLYDIIRENSINFFNNDRFIEYFIKKLKENKPFPLKPKLNLTYIVKSKIEDEDITINNIPEINKIGIVKCNKVDFENPFSEKGKENMNFYLIRLMLRLKNNIQLDDEGNYNKILAEIIDVGVPVYSSYDRKTKWNKIISNIKINGIYCYNLNALINDLENIIFETKETNDPIKIVKLNKRINRLTFFKNLICIIPRLIYTNETILPKETGLNIDQYTNICEEIIDKICPIETKKQKDYLNSILSSIYLNFPETINPINLDIFSILKQYFRYKLIDEVENLNNFHNKIFETPNLELLKRLSISEGQDDIMDNIYFSGYFTIFEEYNPSMYKCSKINFRLFQFISMIIDNFKYKFENTEQIKQLLCMLFLSYSKFIMNFNNNSLYNESLLSFFNVLKNIYNSALKNPLQIITKQSIELSIITDRQLLRQILNDTKKMNKSIIHKMQYPLMKLSLYIKEKFDLKLYLRGSYAYNIHRVLRNNYDNDDLYFNDIDMIIVLNSENKNEFIEKASSIFKMYDEYFNDYFMNNKQYLMDDANQLFSIDTYVFEQSNSILYQILLNRYIPLSEEPNINSMFNIALNEINIRETQKKFRIISYHIFEINVTNEIYGTFSTIDEIILDPYLINNYDENKMKFENYLSSIKRNNNTRYENEMMIKEDDINFNNFYIQNIEGLSNDYNNIILDDNDILIKNIYIERLLKLSTI